jgi:chromosome partitioning protein
MGTIVLIGGEKGGSGKSTIAVNLAAYLAQEGQDVMLLDADPQGSAADWVTNRNEDTSLPAVHCTQKYGDIYKTTLDLGARYSVVVVDAGGRDSKELRTAMVAADVLYIPLRPSQYDLRTLPKMNELADLARGMNPNLRVRTLLCMTPTNLMNKEKADAQELLAHFPDLPLSACTISDRKVYRDALPKGRGVVEMGASPAKAEIQLLAQEIFQ